MVSFATLAALLIIPFMAGLISAECEDKQPRLMTGSSLKITVSCKWLAEMGWCAVFRRFPTNSQCRKSCGFCTPSDEKKTEAEKTADKRWSYEGFKTDTDQASIQLEDQD